MLSNLDIYVEQGSADKLCAPIVYVYVVIRVLRLFTQ